MTVTLVAAVAQGGVIGAAGDIPWRLPGEQARFKALTLGHVLVMGRLTYDSIGRTLPGRTTVVVTRQPEWTPAGGADEWVLVAASVEAALALAATIDDEVFVVGGSQIYAAALPYADVLELTWVDAAPTGDAFFPEVDWRGWHESVREGHDGWQAVRYQRSGKIS